MIHTKLKDTIELRLLIASKGKSLREFSRVINISHSYLSQVLNGQKNPSPKIAYKIANGLGVNLHDIFLIEVVDKYTIKSKTSGKENNSVRH